MNSRPTAVSWLVLLLACSCGGFTQIGEGSGDSGAGGESGDPGTSGSSGSRASGGSAGRTGTAGVGSAGTGGGGTSATGGSGNTGNTANVGGGAGYEPCSGKPCGASCSHCDPNDTDCAEPAVLNYCDAGGNCSTTFPTCELPECEVAADCPLTGYPCQECLGGAMACPIAQCIEQRCQTSFPTCISECTVDSDCPASLAPCQQCPDGTAACPWAHCVNGACQNGIDTCDGTDACAGKTCGQTCWPCSGADCPAIPEVVAYCNENLECQLNVPECANRCETHDECNMTDDCPQCPGVSGCAARSCVDGACVLECPAPQDPCGGCASGEECIYQVGGPGPSQGFICVEVTPCRAAELCACIDNQGTCFFKEASADEPGYCTCDNGLE
jgi:hypothetical protein